ncbi:ParB/RepB/Spo0J family partition protein [Roseobacter sp. A03A-229]
MAKRKRLTPPAPRSEAAEGAPETKSVFPRYPMGVAPAAQTRAPIAQVAGEAAAQSALEELADEMRSARSTGRLVQSLPLEAITEDHLVRDRIALDAGEMETLKNSLRARGQQTPIEVVEQPGGFGLISGWRRLHALRALHAETGEARFATIAALIKPIDTVSDSYVAMVEENEIRAPLSFYERAHLACEAVRLGVYASAAEAVKTLFANAPAARRSKILSFVKLHQGLGAALRFPEAIPEKVGLALVSALEADAGFASRLTAQLRKAAPETAEAERQVLDRALKRPGASTAPVRQEVAPGIALEARQGRLVLSGGGVTPELQRDLLAWLAAR